jgi:hypothetical protein
MKAVPSAAASTRRNLRVPTAARLSGRTALAAFVAALVVGILGMHALGTHGTTTAPAPATASSTATTGAMPAHESMTSGDSSPAHDHAAVSSASTSATTSGADTEAEADAGSGSGHDMGAMAVLCVVMLAAAALRFLVLLAVRIVRPLLPAAFHPAAAPARALPWVRGTGPPHVWAFSVIRC